MLSTAAKNILVYALKIRHERGEDIEEILKGYRNLTDAEKYEVLRAVIEEGSCGPNKPRTKD